MLDYRNIIYKIFQTNEIYGLDALYYISFYIYCISIKKSNNYEELEKVRIELVNRYNIFSLINVRVLELQIINKLEIASRGVAIDCKKYINDFFEYYIENDTLINVKEYSKFYNNQKLTNWITNLIKPINNNLTVYDGNIKINSYLENMINMDNYKKFYGNQTNQQINDLIIFNIYLNNYHLNNQITNHDILSDDLISKKNQTDKNSFFDIIIYDFSNSQHNIIHANCCQKIKKLKIRGTKYEPLLLQLIMMSLNKNGKALLIIPDILLFSDSSQVIETRQYLLENFNVKKICQVDDSLLNFKSIASGAYAQRPMKHSILYFENNGTTNNITFTKLNSNLEENNIITVNINQLKENNYSMYYKLYTEIKNNPKELNFIELSKLFEICEKPNEKCLMVNKYYKSTESVKFLIGCELSNKSSDVYYLILKNNNGFIDDFLFYYIENTINRKINLYIKGKMNQVDIAKLYMMNIPILPIEIQNAVCNYYKTINGIYNSNLNKIEMYQNLINDLFKTISTTNNIELNKIAELSNEKQNDLIGIIKNGLSAGTVYLPEELSNNSYYLKINNSDYLPKYVYYWLKYNQNKLSELSSLTSQMNLNKSNLLSFIIPSIDINTQNNIISYAQTFNELIDNYILESNSLKEKDIINIITQIHNL